MLAAFAALAIDLPVARFLRVHPPRGDLRRFLMLGETFGFGLSVGLIIVTAGVLDARRWRVVPRLALLSFGAGVSANIVKLLIARSRPLTIDLRGDVWTTFLGLLPVSKIQDQWGYAAQSFPSAHTATAAGLAIGLATLYPQGRWLFAGFAVLAGLQRIVGGAHFLSDTLVGAALAFFIAAVVQRFALSRSSTR